MESEESKYFLREIEKNDGCALKVNQCYLGDVGCVVWDAAIVLAKYLETKQFYDASSGVNVWSGRTVVELGAGTGAVGLMAATLGAHVILTDLEELQSLLQLNIQENQALISGSITAKVLKCALDACSIIQVGKTSKVDSVHLDVRFSVGEMFHHSSKGEDVSEFLPPPHYVLMADCIYYEQSIVPLLGSLKRLCGPDTCIICCYEKRTEGVNPEVERQFLELLQQNFSCERIPSDKQDPEFSSPDIHILHIRRKV